MKKMIFALTVLASVTACSEVNKDVGLKDDNPLEQAVEEVIKSETGIIVDLTPETQV